MAAIDSSNEWTKHVGRRPIARKRSLARHGFHILVASLFLYYWTPGALPPSISLPKIIGFALALYVYLKLLYPLSTRSHGLLRRLLFVVVPIMIFLLFEFLSNFQSMKESPTELAVRGLGALIWASLPVFFIEKYRDIEAVSKRYLFTLLLVHAGIVANGLGLVSFDFGTQGQQKVFAEFSDLSAFRSAGFMVNFGEVAIITAFGLPLAAQGFLSSHTRRHAKLILLVLFMASAAGAAISLSRNVWLSTAIAFLVYFCSGAFGFRKTPDGALRAILFVGLVILGSGLFGTIVDDLFSAAQSVRSESIDDRLSQYQAAVSEIQKNPILGPGPGYKYNNVEVHNIYLNSFVHAGLGGLFLCLLLLYILLKLLLRVVRGETRYRAILGGYMGMLTSISFYPVLLSSAPVFWLTLGICFAAATTPEFKSRACGSVNVN